MFAVFEVCYGDLGERFNSREEALAWMAEQGIHDDDRDYFLEEL